MFELHVESVNDNGDFGSEILCILHYNMDMSLGR